MSLKCVRCGREAKYVYKGTSLCKEHLDQELNEGTSLSNSEIVVIESPEVPE